MSFKSITSAFKVISIILYVVIIIITLTLSAIALYLAINDIMSMVTLKSISDVKVLGALSAVFLVVVALEFVDMFIEYVRTGTVVIDLVLAVVLTAISRELLLYVASPSEPIYYGAVLVASVLVVSIAYWLISRAKVINHG